MTALRPPLQIIDTAASADDVFSDLDQIRTGIAFYTKDFDLVFANKALRDYLPNLYEIIDQGGTVLEGIESQIKALSPEMDAIDTEARAKIILGKIKAEGTFEINTPTGIRLQSTYSKTTQGSYILTTTDVTDHIKTEEKLTRSRHDAEAANHAKSEFLANMSHEIRTPMSGVFMAAQLLQRELVALNHPKLSELADVLVGSSEHLSGIINDVLIMSKIEAGQIEIMPKEGSLAQLLRLLIKSQEHVAEKSDLDLKLVIDPNLPDLLTYDPLRVRQCVMNLINNAMKFTESGCVTVAVMFDPQNGGVTIHVADTGIGIAREKHGKIFSQFGQAADANTQSLAGTGLGLSISRNLAQLMGGDIKLVSELGKGSIFSLTFKCHPHVSDADD